MRFAVVHAALGIVAGCGAAAPPPAANVDPPAATERARDYAIAFGGARVGTAHETEAWSARGVHLVREERMRFTRGDDLVEIATAIAIDADRALVPSRVTWTERTNGSDRHGEATRDPARGWTVTIDDGAPFAIPDATAIPAELAPLLVRRDGRFTGRVFLPARGFLAGTGRIEPIGGLPTSRLIARLAFAGEGGADGPAVEATIDLGADRAPVRVVDGEGVIEMRISAAEAAAPFPLVDLIAAASVPILGHRRAGATAITLDGDYALPAVPGQRERTDGALALSPRLPGALPPGPPGADRAGDIALLVRAVRDRIAPDLAAAPAASARDAVAATAGDCTTFALAYTALAEERAIPTRVVTGLRIAGDHLVRHRWAVSWTGRAWIAVDAAYGEAPAGGELVGLAIHGADDAGLVAGEAALAHVHAARW